MVKSMTTDPSELYIKDTVLYLINQRAGQGYTIGFFETQDQAESFAKEFNDLIKKYGGDPFGILKE